ncbi:MAG TPA: NrtA/SsuA/CpmA family ABC transporter substrate-binding protein [Mucilaginibacter sp.]|nr:NrtA/SsuA/CpmA family ABC transporter substrate-binding protein [Mucilaginibacter sp.]
MSTINIGIQNSPSNALVIIAANKKFFDTSKVKVVVKEFSAGKLALQALLGQSGDLDVAVSAETPVILSSLGGNKVKVISEIVNAKNECRVVARKDADLTTPEKYFSKPRKLTTSLGGSPEWLTYNFIKEYNLDKNKVEVIAMLPENMPAALSNGSVDAISIFDPFARIGETQLGTQGITFYNKNIASYYVLSVRDAVAVSKKPALEEILKGLLKAQEFIKNNPEESKQIVAAQTNLDISIINSTWNNYSFSLRLDDSFIELCNQQANWAIESGKYPKTTVIPNFKEITDVEILRKVAPNNVDIK